MFNTVTLRQKFNSKEYNKLENELRIKLFTLQRECEEYKLAVLVTLAGVDGAGKGKVMNLLSKWLDNKKLRTHTFWRKSEDEKNRPDSWRYWMKLPQQGEFGVFFGGWYGDPIRMATYGEISDAKLDSIIGRHLERERTLADNDCVLVKLWLHLDKEEHAKRFEERQKEVGKYHFSPYNADADATYEEMIEVVSKVITMTDKYFSPWYIIDAYDEEFRNVTAANALIQVIENAIEKKKKIIKEREEEKIEKAEKLNKESKENKEDKSKEGFLTILDRVDLSKTTEKADYNKEIKELQAEIGKLTYEAYQNGISSTLVFEGVDAAGKGGAIRRIACAVDARITHVIPISSPTDEELSHHYLWRFWRHVPLAGYVTIYDRSWYGRVLVERVEGFSPESVWKKAYSEINNFEEQLVEGKNILLKFWIQISQEEQLNRFKEREKTPWKQYKITDEDWRNRDKADAYKIAAEEMFLRTDTLDAPWHIIPGESKYYARLEILKIYREALRKALGKNIKHEEKIKLKSVEDVLSDNEENEKKAKKKHKK